MVILTQTWGNIILSDWLLGLTTSFFLLDRVCDSGEAGRTSFAGDRTHAVYLDGADKFCRVECAPRSARRVGCEGSHGSYLIVRLCRYRALTSAVVLRFFLQRFTEILEPFCNNPKTEVTLINAVQSYCYEDTRVMKAFPQLLKVWFPRVGDLKILSSHNSWRFVGLVQQGLHLRPGHHLLVPKRSQAEWQATFLESCGTFGEGT